MARAIQGPPRPMWTIVHPYSLPFYNIRAFNLNVPRKLAGYEHINANHLFAPLRMHKTCRSRSCSATKQSGAPVETGTMNGERKDDVEGDADESSVGVAR
jgi:hypothetical protein